MSITLIAHRGCINGPNSDENKPELVIHTLNCSYDAEIDLWKIDDKLYLGHDAPTYEIPPIFLRSQGLWIHAKNLPALEYLYKLDEIPGYTHINYFWHDTDDFTITSQGYLWSFPNKAVNGMIINQPEFKRDLSNVSREDLVNWLGEFAQGKTYKGICSKYVGQYQEILDC